MIVLAFVSIGMCLATFYIYVKMKYRFADKIPTIEPMVPFLGHGLQFLWNNSYQTFAMLNRIYSNHKSFRLFKLQMGLIPVLCPMHPDLIHKVITDSSCLEKPYPYKFMGVNSGLLSAKYDTWKVHRKLLNPAFNTRIVGSFISIFNDCVDEMIENIEGKAAPGRALNILDFTTPCTMTMVLRTSVGSKLLKPDEIQKVTENMVTVVGSVGFRFFNGNLHPDIVYRFTRFYQREIQSRKICYDLIDKTITEKQQELTTAKDKQELNDNSGNSDHFVNDEKNKPQIFIEKLLMMSLPDGKPFSHKEICEHVYTLAAAGSETSATQAAHALLYLAMHPEIQMRAVQEIKELLPTAECKITPEVVGNMVYMERIIKEAQRLAPVIPTLARQAMTDLQLDAFAIPKGTYFILNLFVLHHMKEYWGEDAEMFNPDRFLPENSENRHAFAFLPFSDGNRGCIGKRYAMTSMKIIVAEVLRNFIITTDLKYEEIEFKFKLSLHLVGPHRTFVEPRKLYGP
ncbi:cytochrome P450 4c21-like [Armigeres subalbatus]|uniref:cytochrome P450 4c21-like n=1 Tax=Armigeres subalbatus TaxID=124917 RepID=UPI002ED4B4ED